MGQRLFFALLAAIVVTLGLGSCRSGKTRTLHNADTLPQAGILSPTHTDTSTSAPCDAMPRHATGFEVERREGYTILSLHDPQQTGGATTRFALVPRGTTPAIPADPDLTTIETPVRSVVCMTSLQLSNLIALGLTDAVVGVTSTRHLHNPTMQARLADGRTSRIGIEGNFDAEVIMALDPDLIIISPYKRGGYETLHNVGIPLLPHFGYQETTPLGQAEWIKCIGELFDRRAGADSLFAAIERRYDSLRTLTADIPAGERPSVLSGELRGANWYAVGGDSYLARLFGDAGADYFLRGDTRAGGVILDFEQVYAGASDARYWRILNSFDGLFSYDVLRREDARYADFRAWRERGVIYCNMHDVPFYEQTPVEPDVVLADFIKVFHPHLVPDHRPVYYKLLQ